MSQFEWLETRTEYREVRKAAHGDELRWIVNRETIRNRATGQTVTRSIIRHPGVPGGANTHRHLANVSTASTIA